MKDKRQHIHVFLTAKDETSRWEHANSPYVSNLDGSLPGKARTDITALKKRYLKYGYGVDIERKEISE